MNHDQEESYTNHCNQHYHSGPNIDRRPVLEPAAGYHSDPFWIGRNAQWLDSKPLAVLGLPVFIFGAHILCTFGTAIDPKHKNISQKMYRLLLMLCPVVSIVCAAAIYGYALALPMGGWLNSAFFMNLLMGILFFVIGNYLPKCHQNYTVGIKLPWTLADENNWYLTHRFAGRLYAIVGILCIINAFIQLRWMIPGVIIAVILLPAGYSLALHLKEMKKDR